MPQVVWTDDSQCAFFPVSCFMSAGAAKLETNEYPYLLPKSSLRNNFTYEPLSADATNIMGEVVIWNGIFGLGFNAVISYVTAFARYGDLLVSKTIEPVRMSSVMTTT
jgi:hypothetical protein